MMYVGMPRLYPILSAACGVPSGVRLIAATALLVLALAAPAAAAAAQYQSPPWEPGFDSAKAYAKQRKGIVGFAVRTESRFWGWNQRRQMPSASVIKAMILVAYLDRAERSGRGLSEADVSRLDAAIRVSDNYSASRLFRRMPRGALREIARRGVYEVLLR
jgi:hypothetical protein